MDSWEEIRNFLTNQITKRRFNLWLQDLEQTADGRVLGASIAIDLLSGALELNELAAVFDDLDNNTTPVRAFARVLDQEPHNSRLICCSPFPEPPDDATPHLYVRILEMDSFLSYYAQPTYYYSSAPDDRAEVYELFLKDHDKFRDGQVVKFNDLADIDRTWSGDRGRVWVLALSDFEKIRAEHLSNLATVLNDALGLGYRAGGGPSGNPDFVAVYYPEFFVEKCKQPTSADAQWRRPSFYISNGKGDGWGRTHSCSGMYDPVPERVHGEIVHFSGEGFSVWRIGEAMAPIVNRDALLEAAFNRYKNIRSQNATP